MLLNQKYNRKVKKLTSQLISSLTDFQEGSENHESCMEFSLSNFYYHRFLEADSHKINRQIKGLCEKFLIYSQPTKSQSLKELFEKFLSSDISETIFSQSSCHYGLIAILLHLSDSPVNQTYTKIDKVSLPEKKDEFDWTSYLLEGEDIPSYWPWDESPPGSDVEEFESDKTLGDMEETGQQHQIIDRNVKKKESSFVASEIICSYWKLQKPVHLKRDDFAKLCSLSSPTSVAEKCTNLQELNIMREILWLLSGHKNLFVFPEKNGKHCISEQVQLSHASDESITQSLLAFSHCGDIVQKLRNFIFHAGSRQSLTYEAFSTSLLSYFNWLQSDLLTIEKRLTILEETLLLDDLMEMLSLHIRILNLLNNIFECTIGCDKAEDKNADRVSRLLCVLYQAVLDEDSICSNQASISTLTATDVVLNLWLDSIQPYIDIIDRWITLGILVDPKSEFPLQRVQTSDCQVANFWKDAITPAIDSIDTTLPWLSPLLHVIVTGGKSMEILQTLSVLCRKNRDQMRDIVPNPNKDQKQSVYEFFRQKLNQSSNVSFPKSQSTSQNISKTDRTILNGDDGLLQANFIKLFACCSPMSSDISMEKQKIGRDPLPVLVLKSLSPIIDIKCNYACERLIKIFKAKFGLSESLDIFHNFHLMGWGDVMHHFSVGIFEELLVNDKLTDDLVSVNVLMQEALAWKSMGPRQVFVAIRGKSNEEKKDGGLIIKAKSQQPKLNKNNMINATDKIELQFIVEWPVNLVVSEKCIAVYNQIFSYLMQIKRAVFCVESLQFSAIYSQQKDESQTVAEETTSLQDKSHRLSILRARMLHLLQHWHGFVMTSIIQAEKHLFSKCIDDAKTLDDILSAHHAFLDRICALCLLDDKKQAGKLVQGTLKKIMTLSITFNMLWRRGVYHISATSLQKHESDFNECSEFLGRILKTIANRGAVPILDSLAYALLS